MASSRHVTIRKRSPSSNAIKINGGEGEKEEEGEGGGGGRRKNLRRTQIKRVVKSKGILKAPLAAVIRQLTSNRGSQHDLGVHFREGGKPEDPEKIPRSTGETNYNNSILT